jgi:hypothetical protein
LNFIRCSTSTPCMKQISRNIEKINFSYF